MAAGMEQLDTDVLVMGAGLAGITAALWAARSGAKVCIAANGVIGSGSSFYPGTWGLGLIGPESKEDEKDLMEVILEIGEGMADKELVSCLVSGVSEGIASLKELGAEVKDAVNKGEREFVPCFDKKCRDWHGIVKEGTKEALLAALEELDVKLLPRTAITDIRIENGRIAGAEAVRRGKDGGFLLISCKAMVIACGGLGGLFSRRLNTPDVTGIGQFLALKAGASLMNLEFMQMMPGFFRPAPKTIYNEKVFRYSEFFCPDTGASVFADWSREKSEKLMEIRSGHGPFTSRLDSREIDIRLYQEGLKHKEGIVLRYKKELKENQPEFVRTYFRWLKEEKGLTIDDPVYMGIFAHASNGGIRIDRRAETGVNGLFACGEAAGGMHGADRLGGLSTANALVFGKIAGESAAEWCRGNTVQFRGKCSEEDLEEGKDKNINPKKARTEILDADRLLTRLQKNNYRAAMVVREEKVLLEALRELETLKGEGERQRRSLDEAEAEDGRGNAAEGKLRSLPPWERYQKTRELEAAFVLSEALLQAAQLRKESRGSHYRLDYPKKDKELEVPVIVSWKDGEVHLEQKRNER